MLNTHLIVSNNTSVSLLKTEAQKILRSDQDRYKRELIERMAHLQARPALIAENFGITPDKAKSLFERVTNQTPSRGRHPEMPSWFVESGDRHLQAVWLYKHHHQYFVCATSHLEKMEALIITYENYKMEPFEDHKLSFDRFNHLIVSIVKEKK